MTRRDLLKLALTTCGAAACAKGSGLASVRMLRRQPVLPAHWDRCEKWRLPEGSLFGSKSGRRYWSRIRNMPIWWYNNAGS